jgi:signal recognition particle subunit SRP54
MAASRKRRVAAGAGLDVAELNRLLKMHRQMADVMKRMGKMGKGGMLRQAMKQMMGGKGAGGGDLPADFASMDPAQLEEAAKAMKAGMGAKGLPGGLPGGLGGLGGMGGLKLPGGLSGLGFGKKK